MHYCFEFDNSYDMRNSHFDSFKVNYSLGESILKFQEISLPLYFICFLSLCVLS